MRNLVRYAAIGAAMLLPIAAAQAATISTIDGQTLVSSSDGVDPGEMFTVQIDTSTVNTGIFAGYTLIPSGGSTTLDLTFEASEPSVFNNSVVFQATDGLNVLTFTVIDTLEVDLSATLEALFLLEIDGLGADPVLASLFATSSGAVSTDPAFGSVYIQVPPQVAIPVPLGVALMPAALGCLILASRRRQAA